MINTGTSQVFLPAKFHNFAVSGLFFIHKNKRVQFFMKHGVDTLLQSYQQDYTQKNMKMWKNENTNVQTLQKYLFITQ